MLTLEQVRAVNDGLKNGDIHAALRPLEETIDLRHAELPRLEKSTVAALKTGLQTPKNAQIWAEAAFHPNVSVRRFVRKTILGLKRDAAPIAPFLKERLEQFWASEMPLDYSMNAREAAKRREQQEIVAGAVEMFLRTDPRIFIEYYQELVEAQTNTQTQGDEAAQQYRDWQVKHQEYYKAFQAKNNDIIRAEWGEEYLKWENRNQIPWRIWNEISQRAQNAPEVQNLLADLGENPWRPAALQWRPEQLLQAELAGVMQVNSTGPQQEIAAIVRQYFWRWIEDAFNENLSEEQRQKAVQTAHQIVRSHYLWIQEGRDEFWQRIPELLLKSKAALLPEICAVINQNYNAQRNTRAGLWMQFAQGLAHSCRKPYQFKGDEWKVADNITPELLRDLKIEGANQYWNDQIETAAKEFEKQRAAHKAQGETKPVSAPINQTEVAKTEPPKPQLADDNSQIATDWADFEAGNVQLGLDEDGNYVALKISSDAASAPPKSVEETLEIRAARLIESDTAKPTRRLPLWTTYQTKMGDDAKNLLWPRVGPQLWKRYENQLEAFRRVESSEPTELLEKRLTESEIKQWKTDQRRMRRHLIIDDLNDIADLLRAVEGIEAETKINKLLQRPGVKEVAIAQGTTKLRWMAIIPYVGNALNPKVLAVDWWRENWFLAAEWLPIIEQLETLLNGNKRARSWERAQFDPWFAIAYYRVNTPQSRAKFREVLAQSESAPFNLIGPVTALNDIEAWILIIEKSRWQIPQNKELWTAARQNPDSEIAQQLVEKLLQKVSTTAQERGAKFMLEMLDEVPVAELENYSETIVAALESPIVAVKRWALKTLPQLLKPYDDTGAATLAGEMLWSENGALVKDAAKFLGAQEGDAVSSSWDALQDAASLENQTVLEAVFRALANLKKRDKELQLNESAQEKLKMLCEFAPDRFEKFAKKLGGN